MQPPNEIDEIQLQFRDAVVLGATDPFALGLIGGRNPERRLAIHQRNYHTSLTDALLTKFPATEWLLGTARLMGAARSFVRENPPTAPCIAEYGAFFPDFLRQYAETEALPYVPEFARLEWHVGRVAIASEEEVTYQHASWPIDELLKLYLTETAPDQFELVPADLWIEVRGCRGEFQLNRLEAPEFTK